MLPLTLLSVLNLYLEYMLNSSTHECLLRCLKVGFAGKVHLTFPNFNSQKLCGIFFSFLAFFFFFFACSCYSYTVIVNCDKDCLSIPSLDIIWENVALVND